MLNFRLYGELNGQMPLLVLHGLLGSLDNWHTFSTKERAQEDRPIVAIDMRNHGASPHVAGMTYPQMAADVLAIADHLQLEQFDLMGHSMGGKAAMWLALTQETRLNHLIVVDIAPFHYSPRLNGLLHTMQTMPLSSFSSRRQADNWMSSSVSDPFERGFLLKNLSRNAHGKLIWECNLPEIARYYDPEIVSFPATDSRYLGSTLFIGGTQSDYLLPDRWEVAQHYFPNAQLRMIEGARHLPHVQTPDIFTDWVRAYLNTDLS